MDADVGVIGVGTMGSMALWQLAKKEVSVIGFEQFGLGHDRSAAGGDTRIFRTAYSDDHEYVPLLIDARQLWQELEKETNKELLTLNGGLTIGDPDTEFIKNVIKSNDIYDLGCEVLDYNQMRERFPQHKLNPNDVGVLDHQSGFIRSEYAIASAALRAKELGAKLLQNTRVESIKVNEESIEIKANGLKYNVRKLLITTGPWGSEFLPELKENLEIRQVISTWFLTNNLEKFNLEKFPVFRRQVKNNGFYGVPSIDGNMAKIMLRGSNDKVKDPDNLDKNFNPEKIKKLKEMIQEYLPDLFSDPSRINIYMDGFTSDNYPIVGKVPSHENIALLTGFSGQGFKMAPVMGKLAAEILLEEEITHSIDRFKPSRFIKPSPTFSRK